MVSKIAKIPSDSGDAGRASRVVVERDANEKKIVRKISREIIAMIIDGRVKDARKLDYVKRCKSRENGLKGILKNSEILEHARVSERQKVALLVKKPVRSISGVAIVAVMARPASCPGKCIYCPQGENSPKSYTGLEPAARRGRMFEYDPYRQVENRLLQLSSIGHSIDKIELIIMGGTFLSCEKEYQRWFVKRCFDALNGVEGADLSDAQKRNETARSRCVGLTIETRPDFCREEHVDMMLELGATRVELGVQTLSDDVYKRVERGHTVDDVVHATRVMKDAGLKIVYHMMPGLFQSEDEDVRMFAKLFSDARFQPDMIKIYPVLVIEGTGLHELWVSGDYLALDNDSACRRVARMMAEVPSHVRIMRCQRDIPAGKIVAGPTAGNLREMAEEYLKASGGSCKCIRCHEAGHVSYKTGAVPLNPEIRVHEYDASSGREYFISYEDVSLGIILGFIRLRVPSKSAHRAEVEVDNLTGIVRELKVFGTSLEISKHESGSFQHKGIGGMLLSRAEEIASESGAGRVLVISAIGTREYYRKFGYSPVGPYMGKQIRKN